MYAFPHTNKCHPKIYCIWRKQVLWGQRRSKIRDIWNNWPWTTIFSCQYCLCHFSPFFGKHVYLWFFGLLKLVSIFITVCQIKADFLKKDLSYFYSQILPIKTIVHKCKATFQFEIQFAQTLRKDCLENVLNLCELTFSIVIYNQHQQQQQQHLKSTDSILSEPHHYDN